METISKRNPEFGEIAQSLGVKNSEVAEMDVRMGTRDLSLNEFINDDGDNQEGMGLQGAKTVCNPLF